MLLIFFLLTLSVAVIALVVTVPNDGYGSRPGPPSHEDHDSALGYQHRSLR